MIPDTKYTGLEYWEYMLCYIDDLLCIHEDPNISIKPIQTKFKLNYDKMDATTSYLGADIYNITNQDGDICWDMSSYRYCEDLVNNTEEVIKTHRILFPNKSLTPLTGGYKSELDYNG